VNITKVRRAKEKSQKVTLPLRGVPRLGYSYLNNRNKFSFKGKIQGTPVIPKALSLGTSKERPTRKGPSLWGGEALYREEPKVKKDMKKATLVQGRLPRGVVDKKKKGKEKRKRIGGKKRKGCGLRKKRPLRKDFATRGGKEIGLKRGGREKRLLKGKKGGVTHL